MRMNAMYYDMRTVLNPEVCSVQWRFLSGDEQDQLIVLKFSDRYKRLAHVPEHLHIRTHLNKVVCSTSQQGMLDYSSKVGVIYLRGNDQSIHYYPTMLQHGAEDHTGKQYKYVPGFDAFTRSLAHEIETCVKDFVYSSIDEQDRQFFDKWFPLRNVGAVAQPVARLIPMELPVKTNYVNFRSYPVKREDVQAFVLGIYAADVFTAPVKFLDSELLEEVTDDVRIFTNHINGNGYCDISWLGTDKRSDKRREAFRRCVELFGSPYGGPFNK